MANGGAISGTRQRVGSSDQERGLSGPYLRATYQYLTDHGLTEEDVAAVSEILGKYAEEEAEDAGTTGTRGTFAGYVAQDARRRRIAQDAALPAHLRRDPTPAMSTRQAASYAERFPGADKIKVV